MERGGEGGLKAERAWKAFPSVMLLRPALVTRDTAIQQASG